MTASDSFLVMRGIEKRFGDVCALDKVSLHVRRGEIHALLGVNGAGKSTLIKILSGVYSKDQGEILIDGQPHTIGTPRAAIEAGIAVVQQHPELVGDLTGAENIFLGNEARQTGLFGVLNNAQIAKRADELADRFGLKIDLHRPVNEMPAVDREIVAILHALRLDNACILILDEPTSTLTEQEKASLFAMMNTLREKGLAIIYITHHLEEVFEIADGFTVFRGGRNVATHSVSEARTRNISIANLMLDEVAGHIFPKRSADTAGEIVLDVKGLTREGQFEDVTFSVRKGEILGLFGLVGSGIDELSKTLFGALQPDRGDIWLKSQKTRLRSTGDALKKGIFLVPGDRRTEGLSMHENVVFNTTLANLSRASFLGFMRMGRNRRDTRSLAQRVDLQPLNLDRPLRGFSGGNQQKVVIAKGLYRQADLYIFVEPTVGVDIGARSKIYRLMRELSETAAVIVMSSDCDEVHGVADRSVAFYKGAAVGEPTRDISRGQLFDAGIMGGRTNVQ